ncbi:MAG: hypothetical protein JSW42_07800, partial [Chloroflexota bacterium]
MNKINSVPMLLSELLVIVVFSACTLVNQKTGTPDTSDHIGWYQVYFTEPESPKASTLRDGPDAALVEAIDQARLSVEMAMDSLDLWSLREALLAAHRRGVDVRV